MTLEDAEAAGDVITGSILVDSLPAIALFDSGASHSFISVDFLMRHSMITEQLRKSIKILTGGGIIPVSDACRSCPVIVCGRELRARLLVMPIPSFDVIFGMDWLSLYHATIDCHRGSVIFRPPGKSELEFVRGARELGSKIICGALVAADAAPQHPVISEFMDFFPEELPG